MPGNPSEKGIKRNEISRGETEPIFDRVEIALNIAIYRKAQEKNQPPSLPKTERYRQEEPSIQFLWEDDAITRTIGGYVKKDSLGTWLHIEINAWHDVQGPDKIALRQWQHQKLFRISAKAGKEFLLDTLTTAHEIVFNWHLSDLTRVTELRHRLT